MVYLGQPGGRLPSRRSVERLTDTIVDIREVQAELDRAARDAESGPAEVRAGRFIHEAAEEVNGGAGKSVAKES